MINSRLDAELSRTLSRSLESAGPFLRRRLWIWPLVGAPRR